MKNYSPYQFSIFRIILGIYLCFHFASLLPYAAEVWSNQGIFADASLNLTYGIFPNVLNVLDSPSFVTGFIGLLFLLSICFLIGFQRPIVSILIWYGWVSLFDRNNLINNPGIPYIGWILLCCAVLPKGEPLSFSKIENPEKWKMPMIIFIGAWLLMSIGYTISGFDKFQSPSWRNGTAIFHLLENPLARDWWLRELFLQAPEFVLKLKTWGVLFIEMAFLPLALLKATRKWIWLLMIGMHLGILMIVDFADLTLGMLMIHWFTFDANWLKPKPEKSGIVFFDGVCGMCNNVVNFLMSEDQGNSLQFAPLQGETAKQYLEEEYLTNMSTICFKQDDQIYQKSDAVLYAVASMGGMWKVVLVFKLIPRIVRDSIYSFIAKNRYRWFGKKESCRMPKPGELDKILS